MEVGWPIPGAPLPLGFPIIYQVRDLCFAVNLMKYQHFNKQNTEIVSWCSKHIHDLISSVNIFSFKVKQNITYKTLQTLTWPQPVPTACALPRPDCPSHVAS